MAASVYLLSRLHKNENKTFYSRYVKGVPFFEEKYIKGVPLLSKWYMKGKGVKPRGGASQY